MNKNETYSTGRRKAIGSLGVGLATLAVPAVQRQPHRRPRIHR
ncbi:hypothetical protein [Parachryseolinea silvisoli]|nr:hypothetical protein [Parachryseolinea silvisoli]